MTTPASSTATPAAAESVLTLSAVVKEYASGGHALRVLDGLDLDVREGETVAITGASGSGKSTLLNLLAGLDRPTSGSVRFRGQPIEGWSEDRLAEWRRTQVGFIFQDFRLLPRLTALENVALALEVLGEPPREAARRAAEALGQLGLGERLTHFPDQLSGGERQRVAIARAFIHRPALVFADEPTGNLDPDTGARVLEQLLAVDAASRTTLVLVTHDAEVAARMGRHVRLVRGRAQ